MWIRSVISGVNKVGITTGCYAVFILMLLTSADVIGRTFLNTPLVGTVEFSKIILAVSVFMSIAYVQEKDAHIRVVVLINVLSPKIKKVVLVLMDIGALLIFILLSWAAGESAYLSWSVREATPAQIAVPVYPGKTLIFIGCVVMCVQLFCTIFGKIGRNTGK